MALPAVTVYYIFGCRKLLGRNFFSRFAAGALAVVMACALQASVLYLSDDKFIAPIIALLTGHVPVMIIDGLLTAWALAFLIKVRPESLCFEIEQVPGDA
jgi:cobalt/nickel transport system permease protein